MSSAVALPLWRGGSLPWRSDLAPLAESLAAEARRLPEPALARALAAEIGSRIAAFQAGIEAYRGDPYRRVLADPPEIWRVGTTRLLDYGDPTAQAPAVLVVPSLVNRPWILDLSARRSLLRWLALRGCRSFLVDWDAPGEAERSFTLDDYLVRRLEPALSVAREASGGRVAVLGYCMGGLLALALAQRRPADVAGLALLATPWDFHADSPWPLASLRPVLAGLAGLAQALGALPVDLLQVAFFSLDPLLAARKFSAFAARAAHGADTAHYVAVEDWANDGVPLAGPVARECLLSWYGANEPAGGRWRVAGAPVEPGRLSCPALVILPRRDRLVPYASAQALARAIPGARRLEPDLGHIGMVVGERAPDDVWGPLADWLRTIGPDRNDAGRSARKRPPRRQESGIPSPKRRPKGRRRKP